MYILYHLKYLVDLSVNGSAMILGLLFGELSIFL